tara:strand:+ start:423 stop:572 length:150 start_codon:yes stop_codon:yes gene_type:complete
MIPFIVVSVVTLFLINHFIELAVTRKYEKGNDKILNNIKKLNEREEKTK